MTFISAADKTKTNMEVNSNEVFFEPKVVAQESCLHIKSEIYHDVPDYIHVNNLDLRAENSKYITTDLEEGPSEYLNSHENGINSGTNDNAAECVNGSENKKKIKTQCSKFGTAVSSKRGPSCHLKKVHTPGKNCSDTNRSKNRLKEEKNSNCKHQCKLCPVVFKSLSCLKKHEKSPHDKNHPKYHCNKCIYVTLWKGDLNKHIKKVHPGADDETVLYKSQPETISDVEQLGSQNNERFESQTTLSVDLEIKQEDIKFNSTTHYADYDTNGENKPLLKFSKATSEESKAELGNYVLKDDILLPEVNGQDKSKVFQCFECKSNFNTEELLREHYQAKHDQDDVFFMCRYCKFRTETIIVLNAHIDEKHTNRKGAFRCFECGALFKRKATLAHHFQEKHDEHCKTYHCKQCDYENRRKSNVKDHERRVHSEVKMMFPCKLCPMMYTRRNSLTAHINAKHCKEKSEFSCSYCVYVTKWKTDLCRHIRNKHRSSKSSSQLDTTKSAKASEDKNETLNQRNNTHPFQCSECSATFKRKKGLNFHFREKHDPESKIYQCKLCDYTSRRKGRVKEHESSLHSDTKQQFKCQFCPVAYRWISNLNAHVRVKHGKNKPKYNCSKCLYASNGKSDLNRHMRNNHRDETDISEDKVLNSVKYSQNGENLYEYVSSNYQTTHLDDSNVISENSEQLYLPNIKAEGSDENECSFTDFKSINVKAEPLESCTLPSEELDLVFNQDVHIKKEISDEINQQNQLIGLDTVSIKDHFLS